ncbi:hypothetical protein N2152v2_003862 [Parachlorella kessleri]
MVLTDDLLRRQTGEVPNASVARPLSYRRRLGLQFGQSRSLQSVHQGGVTWLDLDLIDHRYLLAGAADASVAVYDTQQQRSAAPGDGLSGEGDGSGGGSGGEVPAVLQISKQTPGAHRFSISSVAWYPVDTGLFVTGGYDNEVKVWDTNSLAVAAGFTLSGRVHAVAMSPCATTHCLVAVGQAKPQVMLCDVTSGGFTHTLSGHRAAVWAVHWSLQTEWQVMTGGCDGQLRLWDIRRAGPLHIFDQHQTQPAPHPRPAALPRSGSGDGKGRANGSSSLHSSRNKSSGSGGRRSGTSGGPAVRGSGSGPGKRGAPETARRRTPKGTLSPGSSMPGNGGDGRQGPPAGDHRMFLPDKVVRYATAHGGSITGVHPTPHGLYWLSAGTDDRVRLWDAMEYRHLLVNYPNAFNRSLRARQLSVADDSRMLFHPSGSAVQLFDVDTGRPLRVLQGAHFDTINCCKWNPVNEELYTGANDCHIVVWAPPLAEAPHEEQGGGSVESDADNWSD